jgi:hypothetical protein
MFITPKKKLRGKTTELSTVLQTPFEFRPRSPISRNQTGAPKRFASEVNNQLWFMQFAWCVWASMDSKKLKCVRGSYSKDSKNCQPFSPK